MGVVCLPTLLVLALAQTGPRYNITAVDVTAPATAVSGEHVSISTTFASNSTDQPASFHFNVYLTLNGVVDASARSLGRYGPVTLGAVDTHTVNQQVTIPTDITGRFTIAVVADSRSAVAEFDELDNTVAALNVTRIRGEEPDALIVSVASRELEAREGEAVRVVITVENAGELPATFTIGAYLSDDRLVSTADHLLGTTDVTVAAGARVDATIDSTVPTVALAGDHTIGAIVDAASTVDEIDELNNVGVAVRPLNIFRDTMEIVTDTLPEGTRGIDYHALIQMSGGNGHYRYTVTNGQLPAGLTLDATSGILSGIPTESGENRFTTTITSHGLTSARSWTVLIDGTGEGLTIVTLTIVGGAIGLPYGEHLIAAGGEPPYRWTVSAGMMPAGLDLRSDGVISGLPTVLGDYQFEVSVTDRLGARDSAVFEVSVTPPVDLLILETDLPDAPIGVAIDRALNVTGGVPPYHWQALSTPPPGLSVTENGHVAGTPTMVGRFPVLVRAEDSTRAGNFDSRLIQVVVVDDGALSIETGTLPPAHLRGGYETEITAKGGTPPLTWSIVPGDDPPPGFFLAPGDGMEHSTDSAVLKGLAIRAYVHAFTVQVEDANGRTSQKLFALEVQGFDASSGSSCTCVATRDRSVGASLAVLFGLFCLAAMLRPIRKS